MKNIVVVAAHPDDEVLGCGGVMARHSRLWRSGPRYRRYPRYFGGILKCFRGHGPPRTVRSSPRAGSALGEVLGFSGPALDVTPGYLVADAIRAALRDVRPDIVYLPHHGDIHGDHRAVNLATIVAARPNGVASAPRLLAYETLSESEWGNPNGSDAFQPTVFIGISEHLKDKLKAMECYQSQLKASPNARSLEAIRALATYRGHTVNLAAAEAFMLVREIIS